MNNLKATWNAEDPQDRAVGRMAIGALGASLLIASLPLLHTFSNSAEIEDVGPPSIPQHVEP